MVRNHFNSVQEFCTAPFVNKHNERRYLKVFQDADGRWLEGADSHNRSKWFGSVSPDEAAARVTRGWPEGAATVLGLVEQINVPDPVSLRRRLHRSDQGDELDIHSVYRGDLDHAWTTRRRKRTRSRMTVRVVVQTNLLAHMHFDELFYRGAAAVKLTDILTAAGYSVEIIGALASDEVDRKNHDFLATMVLKEASTPLDVEQLAGVVCNAGFHRLFGFRSYDALIPWDRVSTDGHGCGTNTDGRIIREARLDADGTTTLVAGYDITTRWKAQQWIEQCLKILEQTTAEM